MMWYWGPCGTHLTFKPNEVNRALWEPIKPVSTTGPGAPFGGIQELITLGPIFV